MSEKGDEKPAKRGKKVRIDLRKNRANPGRDKQSWTRQAKRGDEIAEDAAQGESVRAKGDLSRKRTIIIRDDQGAETPHQSGVVTTVRGLFVEVDDGRQRWACTVRGMLRTRMSDDRAPITVGDEVMFHAVVAGEQAARAVSEDTDLPEGVIEDVQPRRTTLSRQYERRVQVIAANVDQAIIVVAANDPPLRPHLVDRYLVAIHQGKMRPILCINKIDLDKAGETEEVAQRYRGIGYCVVLASVPENKGIDELRELLVGTTSTFVGPSGVGKSSLINTIEPGFDLAVGTLTDLRRGKHTTTTARLLRWSFGGYIVDTPGMRQFDPAAVDKEEIEAYFIEFRDLIQTCKYPNCSHSHETDCAIRDAVESGAISVERYDSYCKMYEEAAARPTY